jgi:hypothetical protein
MDEKNLYVSITIRIPTAIELVMSGELMPLARETTIPKKYRELMHQDEKNYQINDK